MPPEIEPAGGAPKPQTTKDTKYQEGLSS